MLPGPTNVPERIMRAMYVPMINHRSDDFVELYEDCVEKTKKVFMTEGEAVCLSSSGTGAVEASVVNLIKKGDKVIIPVNGEFSSRLSQMLEWAGAMSLNLKHNLVKTLALKMLKRLLITTRMLRHSIVYGTKLLLEL